MILNDVNDITHSHSLKYFNLTVGRSNIVKEMHSLHHMSSPVKLLINKLDVLPGFGGSLGAVSGGVLLPPTSNLSEVVITCI